MTYKLTQVPPAEKAEMDRRFDYHAPDEAKRERHEAVRSIFKEAALDVMEVGVQGRELAIVLTNLEQAMFWANAGIARTQYDETDLP